MSTEIVIAIFASITSLIVAIISLFSTRMNNKDLLKSSTQIEHFKMLLEDKKNRQNIWLGLTNKNIEAIDNSLKLIQKTKDALLLIISAKDVQLDSKTAIDLLSKCKVELFENYQSYLPVLGNEEKKVAHDSKTLIHFAETDLIISLKNKKFVYLDEDFKMKLLDTKNTLTEYQHLLRDIKLSIISGLLENANVVK